MAQKCSRRASTERPGRATADTWPHFGLSGCRCVRAAAARAGALGAGREAGAARAAAGGRRDRRRGRHQPPAGRAVAGARSRAWAPRWAAGRRGLAAHSLSLLRMLLPSAALALAHLLTVHASASACMPTRRALFCPPLDGIQTGRCCHMLCAVGGLYTIGIGTFGGSARDEQRRSGAVPPSGERGRATARADHAAHTPRRRPAWARRARWRAAPGAPPSARRTARRWRARAPRPATSPWATPASCRPRRRTRWRATAAATRAATTATATPRCTARRPPGAEAHADLILPGSRSPGGAQQAGRRAALRACEPAPRNSPSARPGAALGVGYLDAPVRGLRSPSTRRGTGAPRQLCSQSRR